MIMFAEGYYHTQIHPYASWMTEELRGSQHSLGMWTSLLISTVSAGSLLSARAWAMLSNKFGRKRCLLFGLLVCAASTALQAFSQNFWFIVAIRFVGGVMNSNQNVMKVMVREIHQQAKADDSRAFALITSAFGVANMAGPSIGGLLFGRLADAGILHSWSLPMFCVTVLYILALLGVAIGLPDTTQPRRLILPSESPKRPDAAGRSLLRNSSFLMLLLSGGICSYVWVGWEVAYPLLARQSQEDGGEGWNSPAIGWTFFAGSVALVIWSAAVIPFMLRRCSMMQLYGVQWALSVVTLVCFPRLLSWVLSTGADPHSGLVHFLNYGAQILISVLIGTSGIPIQLLINSQAADSPGQLAIANSHLFVVQSIARALSPLVTGPLCKGPTEADGLWEALPFDHLALVGGLVTSVIFLHGWLLRRRAQTQLEETPAAPQVQLVCVVPSKETGDDVMSPKRTLSLKLTESAVTESDEFNAARTTEENSTV